MTGTKKFLAVVMAFVVVLGGGMVFAAGAVEHQDDETPGESTETTPDNETAGEPTAENETAGGTTEVTIDNATVQTLELENVTVENATIDRITVDRAHIGSGEPEAMANDTGTDVGVDDNETSVGVNDTNDTDAGVGTDAPGQNVSEQVGGQDQVVIENVSFEHLELENVSLSDIQNGSADLSDGLTGQNDTDAGAANVTMDNDTDGVEMNETNGTVGQTPQNATIQNLTIESLHVETLHVQQLTVGGQPQMNQTDATNDSDDVDVDVNVSTGDLLDDNESDNQTEGDAANETNASNMSLTIEQMNVSKMSIESLHADSLQIGMPQMDNETDVGVNDTNETDVGMNDTNVTDENETTVEQLTVENVTVGNATTDSLTFDNLTFGFAMQQTGPPHHAR